MIILRYVEDKYLENKSQLNPLLFSCFILPLSWCSHNCNQYVPINCVFEGFETLLIFIFSNAFYWDFWIRKLIEPEFYAIIKINWNLTVENKIIYWIQNNQTFQHLFLIFLSEQITTKLEQIVFFCPSFIACLLHFTWKYKLKNTKKIIF